MNSIENKLTQKQSDFFKKLSLYIDKPLYFYGSVQRPDYIYGKSDIDIDVFTDNESSTIQLLCNFLGTKKNEFRKTIYKIDSTMIYGKKIQYEDISNEINIEISIYNENYKQYILHDHNLCRFLPFHITIILLFIKVMFYNLNIISKKTYKRLKRLIMNKNDELKFIEVDT